MKQEIHTADDRPTAIALQSERVQNLEYENSVVYNSLFYDPIMEQWTVIIFYYE